MRGGHRQFINGGSTARVPKPPKGMPAQQRTIWLELASAVEGLGTFKAEDLMFFRLTVRTVAEAETFDDMPPTARARLLQAAGAMLNAFGLSPLSRERVKVPVKKPAKSGFEGVE